MQENSAVFGTVYPMDISMMKIDCEGCEYFVVPALTDKEFAAIRDLVGEVHWGYIPDKKKPSVKIAVATHRRLCNFKSILEQAKECCEFPDLYSQYGALHKRLCGDYGTWKSRMDLYRRSN